MLLLVCFVVACTSGKSIQGAPGENANAKSAHWLSALIREIETDAPAKIYRYTYNDQEVYYLTGRCCDVPGKLYDVEGNIICEPDGGITGRRDGRCADFFKNRSNETLIWEDKRQIK